MSGLIVAPLFFFFFSFFNLSMDGIGAPYQQQPTPTRPRTLLGIVTSGYRYLEKRIIIILARYVCGVQSLFGLAGWMWPGHPHE